GPVFHTIVSIKNDGHYFCRAGGNRPDGLNEPVTLVLRKGDIEIPSDLAGVLYTELDEHGGWKRKLLSELAYAGVPFDKDKALSA
ncbi:hypothetical protein ACVUSC_23545, partial [Escherichia coli]